MRRLTTRAYGARHGARSPCRCPAAALAVVAPSAVADTVKIDFETPPPAPPAWDNTGNGTRITDAYLTARSRRSSPRTGASGRTATSRRPRALGRVVADVSPDICYPDTGDAGGCEFAVGGTSAGG